MFSPTRAYLAPLTSRVARATRGAPSSQPLLMPKKGQSVQRTQRPQKPGAHIGLTTALPLAAARRLPERPKCLLVQVPMTVIPSDVLRALREIQAVDLNFSIGSLTPPPIGAPRRASLQITYHITARSPGHAEEMYRLISSRPLFGASGDVGPATSRSALSLGGVRDLPSVGFCVLEARDWAAALLRRAEESALTRGGVEWDTIDVDWAINPMLSGRRVLVRGLPGKEMKRGVRHLVQEYADKDPTAVLRLPPAPFSNISCWAITCPTVAAAYALAGQLNANYFLTTEYGHQFPIRAHVIW